jgi:hypothetical protein
MRLKKNLVIVQHFIRYFVYNKDMSVDWIIEIRDGSEFLENILRVAD